MCMSLVAAKLSYIFAAYCAYRVPGLYTYTADYNCYIQCDEWHKTFIQPCAYGTFWKPDGYEPTTYNRLCWNRCVGIKPGEYQYAPSAEYRSAAPKPDPFTITRHEVKTITTSYGEQGQVSQKGNVHHHVHVHQKAPTASPYTAASKPLNYNNLVNMYMNGKPAQYGREATHTNSVDLPDRPQVHQISTHQQKTPAIQPSPAVATSPPVQAYARPPPPQQVYAVPKPPAYTVPKPQAFVPPKPQVYAVPPPRPQALPQIQIAPQPQTPPRPQALPVVRNQQYQIPPNQQQHKQQASQQMFAQPQHQQQPVQLVAQALPARPNVPQNSAIKPLILQQPKPDNRVTLNSHFPVAGHQNTKNPVSSQGMVSNIAPGPSPRSPARRRPPVRRPGRRPGGRALNRKLMDERKRRLAQWQQYIRKSRQQGRNRLNGQGGGDDQLTTAQRRRFHRMRMQKAGPEGESQDIVNDYGNHDANEVDPEHQVENATSEEEVYEDDYVDVSNFVIDDVDQAYEGELSEEDLYENGDVDISNNSMGQDKLNDASNSASVEDEPEDEDVVDVEENNVEQFQHRYVVHNVPTNIPK